MALVRASVGQLLLLALGWVLWFLLGKVRVKSALKGFQNVRFAPLGGCKGCILTHACTKTGPLKLSIQDGPLVHGWVKVSVCGRVLESEDLGQMITSLKFSFLFSNIQKAAMRPTIQGCCKDEVRGFMQGGPLFTK